MRHHLWSIISASIFFVCLSTVNAASLVPGQTIILPDADANIESGNSLVATADIPSIPASTGRTIHESIYRTSVGTLDFLYSVGNPNSVLTPCFIRITGFTAVQLDAQRIPTSALNPPIYAIRSDDGDSLDLTFGVGILTPSAAIRLASDAYDYTADSQIEFWSVDDTGAPPFLIATTPGIFAPRAAPEPSTLTFAAALILACSFGNARLRRKVA